MSEIFLKQTELKMDNLTDLGYLNNVKQIDIQGILSANSNGISAKLTGIEQGTLLALLGWTSDIVFSSTDADTVAWASGNIILADGRTFAIDAGNTGNMTVITYIYLDVSISETVLQTTTVAANSVGGNKLLIAVAQNNSDTASKAVFQAFGGKGGILIKADNIAANSITANEISANGITGALIQTAASGFRALMTSANGFQLYNGATLVGLLRADSGASVILETADDIYLTKGGANMWRFNSNGNIDFSNANTKITWPSGRQIYDASGGVAINGDLLPNSDNTGAVGYSNRQWHEIHGRTLYQSNNTDGSRSVYDEAYIEVNLMPKRLIRKRKNAKEIMVNGYVNGLELPYKQGTIFKWTSGGIRESEKETDFVVAVASNKGLPIVLGAEPVRVIGKSKIGDFIVPSNKKGCAMAIPRKEAYCGMEIIGRCLENKKSDKENLVKVMINFK